MNRISNDPIIDGINATWYCKKGLPIHRSLSKKNITQLICLCPPPYYGHMCQYQNQRVSLTMQVRSSFDFKIPFIIVFTLRDDEEDRIESYDQVNHLYERDCSTKFNIHLLYGTRPKNTSTNHSVRIDIFNSQTLDHRASWLFSIKFAFLPVFRMSVQVQIPPTKMTTRHCAALNCGIHGRCSQYVNMKTSFCLCDKGWSGRHCNIEHECHCSSDSVCFGPNICVCPIHKFGSRCYLKHSNCTCKHGGTCITNDKRLNEEIEDSCLCQKGFSGRRCEIVDTTINLSFASEIPVPTNLLVHFIQVHGKVSPHDRSTTPIKIPLDQETVSIHRSLPFHLVFVEILPSHTYYLTVVQQNFVPSTNISSTIKPINRCLLIDELFNRTMMAWHLLRRMKYYHLPCQQRTNLTCFYDEMHFCICNAHLRQANCLIFNHSMIYDCEEQNPCANEGECFRDSPTCPTIFTCQCQECTYGSQCQFSTKGFGLSLDVILAYHIQLNVPFKQQHLLIHVTTAIVTTMLIFGLLSSAFSIGTFQTKKVLEVGCGYYLLLSSYISIMTIVIFALKFYFLLASQMGSISNHSYLTFNCIALEYLLKVLLSTGDWLNSFVGVERAVAVLQDVRFNKTQTKRLAKWITVCICIVTATTHVHDPVYRRMMDDVNEKQMWCLVQFSSSVKVYNTVILAIHFGGPFLLNIVSALVIIISTARRRSTAQKQQSYLKQLREQFNELKHLLISPLILIVLASPRLVISFLLDCMKTGKRNAWLYFSGYLISFLPPILIAIVFICPSETYKKEFKSTCARLQKCFRRPRS